MGSGFDFVYLYKKFSLRRFRVKQEILVIFAAAATRGIRNYALLENKLNYFWVCYFGDKRGDFKLAQG